MLTIIKIPSSHSCDAKIMLPPETGIPDRARFVRLAAVFYGHASADGSWIFTEMRGRKCLALWEAGFDGNGQHQKSEARPVTRGGLCFNVWEAVRMIKAMQLATTV